MSQYSHSIKLHTIQKLLYGKEIIQAGAELCQAQVKLEVIVYVVEEGWSWRCNLGWG